jgi:hypothetical protein
MGINEPTGPRSRGTPVIYHFAGVRLGGAFPFLGQAGTGHRAHIRETFVRIVDQGLEAAPNVVLITGNLFGTRFPSRDLAEFARSQIARLTQAGIPVLIAAGPLDALSERNYAAGALADLERVSVFPAAPKIVLLPDCDLGVAGVSWASAPVPADFISGLANQRSSRFLVGACFIQWPDTEEGVRSLRRQIARSGAHYLALAGSPVRRDLSTEQVTAWCAGAPELVAPEEGEGAPLVVRIDGGVAVTPMPVARRRFARCTLQPMAYADPEALAAAIRALGNPDLAAVVRLTGSTRINQYIDVAGLRDRLAGEFLSLDIVDESLPGLADPDADVYPELSVAGKFVSVARAEMERAATDEARRRVGQALRLGLALLEGRQMS